MCVVAVMTIKGVQKKKKTAAEVEGAHDASFSHIG